MPTFIQDLIPLILETHEWWPSHLASLARVSPEWRYGVIRMLYTEPSLYSFRACSLLARTYGGNPSLAALTRGLELRPSHTTGVNDADMASLRSLLGIPGLTSLTLGGQLAVQSERFLHSLEHSSEVTSLRVEGGYVNRDGISLRTRASLEWSELIAFKFSNLTELRLSNIELEVAYPSINYPIHLSTLILDNVDVVSGYLVHLANESWSALSCLSITSRSAAETVEQMKLLLDCCADSIKELEWAGCDGYSGERIIDEHTRDMGHLRRLRLSEVDVDNEMLEAISRCCAKLENLSVTGRRVSVAPLEWAMFVQNSTLTELTLPWGTYLPPFKPWEEEDAGRVIAAATPNVLLT